MVRVDGDGETYATVVRFFLSVHCSFNLRDHHFVFPSTSMATVQVESTLVLFHKG